MKLGIEQIREITQGAKKIVFEEGKYRFFRFSEAEAKLTDNQNVDYPAGIQMEFKTDGKSLKLKVNTKSITLIRSYFSFDVFVNNSLVGCIQNLNDEDCTGDYANEKYRDGDYFGEFQLGEGEKLVRIVLPHSIFATIEELEISDATYVTPVKRTKTVVMYGDSITQGYDALHPSKTYAMRMADFLGAELINKALGGITFGLNLAEVAEEILADYVFVAFGTNDWGSCDRESFTKNADAFLKSVEKNYPNVPVFVLTPIWRKDWDGERAFGKFSELERIMREVSEKYRCVKVISGWNLVPGDEKLFGDLILHPSDEGFVYYADNIIKEINGARM